MKKILTILIPALLIGACTGKKTTDAPSPEPAASTPPVELALPAVPDSLTSPEARAAYLALHFWDALDFARDAAARDTAFMEQSFANYISVLDLTPADDAETAFGSLATRAKVAPDAFDLLEYVADRYLDDPNSPMRSELLYQCWLKALKADSDLYADRRLTIDASLERIAKNRPGSIAADFRMLTLRRGESSLHRALGGGRTLLMFYDPDCENCHSIREALASASLSPDISIVAVAVDGTRDAWRADAQALPENWTVAYALEPLEDDEKYVFAALPTFFLLDSKGTVLLKDPAPSMILGR